MKFDILLHVGHYVKSIIIQHLYVYLYVEI